MQKPLNEFIRFIQNAKSSVSKEKDSKKGAKQKTKDNEAATNAKVEIISPVLILKAKNIISQKFKLVKCAKLIPNLVYLIEQYEQQLKLLNKHFENRVSYTCFKSLLSFIFSI